MGWNYKRIVWSSWFGGDDEDAAITPAELVKFKQEVSIKRQWSASVGSGNLDYRNSLRPTANGENIFVADDLLILAADDSDSDPQLLTGSAGLNLWFKSIDKFVSPKGNLLVDFRSPGATNTPEHSALLKLLIAVTVDELNEFSYAARLAGLQ